VTAQTALEPALGSEGGPRAIEVPAGQPECGREATAPNKDAQDLRPYQVARQVNIEAELAAVQRVESDPRLTDAFAALDIHTHPDAYGIDYVSISGDRYRPDARGVGAFIIECAQMVDGRWQVIDLVAATLDGEQTATRLGLARMTGWTWFYRARMRGERLIVHRDVLSWLKRGGVGVAVLDWRAMAAAFLEQSRLLVDSEEHAAFLHGVISPIGPPPPIDIVRSARG
jgi:hypothetical protein